MSIPLNPDYSHHKIYQSDTNKIGPDSVNFGILAPVSEFPIYSGEIIAASDLAVDLVNQHGGINGKRLVMLRADDKENTPVSARLAQQLVNDYKVQAIIGPGTSQSTVEILREVSKLNGVPLISQSASSMVLTELAGEYPFWRMVSNNRQQLELITDFLDQKLGHKRIQLITGRDIYSREMVEGITSYYANVPDGVVEHLAISDKVYLDVMDLSEEIEAMQKQGVSAIVVTLVNAQVAGMIRKIKHNWQGKYPVILIGDTVTPKYLEDAELGDINACIFSYVGTQGDLDPGLSKQIQSAIQTKATGFDGAYVYDATMILAMAKVLQLEFKLPVKQAVQAITGDGVRIGPEDFPDIKALYSKHKSFSYYGFSGRVHFNDRGDNLTAYKKIYSLARKPEDTGTKCMQAP